MTKAKTTFRILIEIISLEVGEKSGINLLPVFLMFHVPGIWTTELSRVYVRKIKKGEVKLRRKTEDSIFDSSKEEE